MGGDDRFQVRMCSFRGCSLLGCRIRGCNLDRTCRYRGIRDRGLLVRINRRSLDPMLSDPKSKYNLADQMATDDRTCLSALSSRPPMFHRAPSTSAENCYADFEPFAFPANRLRQPGTLRRPHALKDHDIRQDEWGFFIEALAHEALRHVDHGNPDHPPRLTKAVHELLRAWQVGYFGPRAVQVYVARDGKKVYEPGFGVPRNRAAPSMRDGRSMYTDTTSYRDVYSDATTTDSSDIDLHEGRFSARQRAYRRERRRQRPRDRRARGGDGGEWEVHFAYTEPTMFKPGLKPRRYGEKVPFERPK